MFGPFIILAGIAVTFVELVTRKPRKAPTAAPTSSPAPSPAVSSESPKETPAAQ